MSSSNLSAAGFESKLGTRDRARVSFVATALVTDFFTGEWPPGRCRASGSKAVGSDGTDLILAK
jgi:hypothetical protein